jgi:hypothetical protein
LSLKGLILNNKGKSTAEAFGAKIDITVPDRGLYLVTGRERLPAAAVRSMGGQIVFVVPESVSLLALLPTVSFLALKGHPEVAHAGPVSIDSARFNHFLELIGLNHNRDEPQ